MPEQDPEQRKRVCALDLVAATPWAIEPAMLNTIRSIATRENESIEALEARYGRPLVNTREVTMRGSVAVVPIAGPIFRYANIFTQVSGATSLDILAKDFTAAMGSAEVSAVVLAIDSPGGQVTGIAEFAQMVRAAGKPVVAYIDGSALSAAYWIAAASSRIVTSQNGHAGNVGAVLSVDTRRDAAVAEIVSSQSPNKRPDVTTDAGRAQIQSLADAHAQVFIEAVANFRHMTPAAVMKDWKGGGVFIGRDAVAVGMADSVGSLEEVLRELNAKHAAPAQKLESRLLDAVSAPVMTQSGCPQIDAIVSEAAESVELGTRDGFVKRCPEVLGKWRAAVSAKQGIAETEVSEELLRKCAAVFAENWNTGARQERERIVAIDDLAKLMCGHDGDLIHAAKFTNPMTTGQLASRIVERETRGIRAGHPFPH